MTILRRSLVPPVLLLLLFCGWLMAPKPTGFWTLFVLLLCLPPVLTTLVEAIRKPRERAWPMHLNAVLKSLGRALAQAGLTLCTLPYCAIINLDAILVSGGRMLFTRRGLLLWYTPRYVRRNNCTSLADFFREMWVAPIFAAGKVTKQTVMFSETAYRKSGEIGKFLTEVANVSLFIIRVMKETFSRDFEVRELMRQCFQIGYKSLPLVSVTGIIMGLVLTIQSRPVLADFGAVSMLPGMVAISLIREMGPVITALICAGKIGSGMGAELGSMKVSEQIDAMEVSAINPVRYLIVTRVWAATLMIPLLILYADALGILGSWAGANIKGKVTFILFFSQAFASVSFIDFLPAVIKSVFFGAVIGVVGCYKGYTAGRGTESVGIAANSAVVISSLLVIIVDAIAVQITDLL